MSFKSCSLFVIGCLIVAETNAFTINEMMKGGTSTLYTPSVYAYNYFWLELYFRDYIVFTVRACSDVHVALLHARSDLTNNITEVVIGGWYNSRSVIRNGAGEIKEHYLDISTPNLLHCIEYRTFWIQWGSRMSVGMGPIPGEQIFMDMERRPNITHGINFISFCTGYGVTGIWKIPENQGHYMILNTPVDYKYQYYWKTADYMNNHFFFRVRACNDVHVNLASSMDHVEFQYEIVIGGWNNTQSVIRFRDQVHQVEYRETGIVSCTELRLFWVSWENSVIRVGKGGDMGRNQFMSATDSKYFPINHVGVSSGWGSTGTWVFNENLENGFKYFLQSADTSYPEYNIFVTVSRQQFIVFEATGCSDIWIAISAYSTFTTGYTHHVYIGGANNTRTGVKLYTFGAPLAESSTPNILNCINPSWFWISWYNGVGQVGRGNLVGFASVVTWNISSFSMVNSVAFSSTHQDGGFVFARRNMGDSLVIWSGVSLHRRQMWVTVRQDVIFRFRVRACHSVQLTLSGIIDLPDVQTYEIVIGACYQTIVRNRIQNDTDTVAVAETPDILSCTQFRSFWISWIDGYVRIGSGSRYRSNEFLVLAQKKPHPINAISVATTGVSGVWELDADVGDYLMLMMPWGDPVMKWFHLHRFVNWFYFQVSGWAAHLVLASRYQDPLDAYNIYIGANENTEISLWRDTTLLQQRFRANILDQVNLRDFWVSWEGGRIILGESKYRGELGIFDYTDPAPLRITAMALAGDRTSYAEYRIWENIASEMTMITEKYTDFGQAWWSVRHRTSILFALNTCGRAEIVLSAVLNDYTANTFTYLLVMNDYRNYTGIWRGYYFRKLTEALTPDTLSCGREQYYWLSWHGGNIALGVGKEKGKQTVVSYQDLDATPVTALSLSTYNAAGIWRIPLTNDEFQVVPRQRKPDVLSAGETTGVVFGGILLVVVFVVLTLAIAAPALLIAIYARIRSTVGRSGEGTGSFENPVSVQAEFSEVRLS